MENKLFGVCSNSMQNIHQVLTQRYGRKHVAILTNQLAQQKDLQYQKQLKRAKLYLAGGIKDVLANQTLLNKRRAPILVFDNIVLLNNYDCKVLDLDGQPNGILQEFKMQAIDYPTLFNAVEQPTNDRHKIKRKNLDLLPQIIKDNTVLGFMDKFNSMLYSITTASNRTEIRNVMVRYVFNKYNEAQFEQQLISNGVKLSNKSKLLFTAVVDYIQSPLGKTLQQALQYAQQMENLAAKENVTKRRTIRYKEIAEKYGVDSFELRNLILLFRGIKK